MYQDLVLPVTATPGDDDALAAGIALAGAFGARLSVLQLVNLPLPVGNPWGLMPEALMGDTYARLRAEAEDHAAALRARLAREAVASEVRLVQAMFTEPERIAAHQAHYADLAIVAGPVGDTAEGDVAQAYFGALLLESGRPVLVVPPRCRSALPPQRVVLAWRPTREAARALHDALPLLKRAAQVDVLVVNPQIRELGHGEEPGSDVAAHLARHGISVDVVRRDTKSRPAGEVLMEHARESGAGLIVAGGYGHSRLREWALGGVTRELLITCPLPVLYSH